MGVQPLKFVGQLSGTDLFLQNEQLALAAEIIAVLPLGDGPSSIAARPNKSLSKSFRKMSEAPVL